MRAANGTGHALRHCHPSHGRARFNQPRHARPNLLLCLASNTPTHPACSPFGLPTCETSSRASNAELPSRRPVRVLLVRAEAPGRCWSLGCQRERRRERGAKVASQPRQTRPTTSRPWCWDAGAPLAPLIVSGLIRWKLLPSRAVMCGVCRAPSHASLMRRIRPVQDNASAGQGPQAAPSPPPAQPVPTVPGAAPRVDCRRRAGPPGRPSTATMETLTDCLHQEQTSSGTHAPRALDTRTQRCSRLTREQQVAHPRLSCSPMSAAAAFQPTTPKILPMVSYLRGWP